MSGDSIENVSVDDLVSSLETYNEQLQGIQSILSENPTNEEFLNLEKDVKELIGLYEVVVRHGRTFVTLSTYLHPLVCLAS